ncbi:T9SS type A sorting domain-containing protein, partial [Bacteroidota bacterium]
NVTDRFKDGYWSFVVDNSFNSTDFDIALTGNGFSSDTITSATRVMKRLNGNIWPATLDGTHSNASGSTCYRAGLNTFVATNTYEFGLGDTDCEAIAAPSITGSTDVCTSASEAYSVTDNSNTYTWTITNGSIASGQGTASITVDWQGTASIEGEVKVVESTGCYDSEPDSVAVNIHSLSTSSISGPNSVPENSTQGPYTVTERSGYTYTWSIPAGNGSISAGDGTASVTVAWGATSAATLRVVGQYGSCTAAANSDLAVDVFTSIASTTDGLWNVDATWGGNPFPTAGDNAKISSGTTVTLDASRSITNLTIEGTLDHTATPYNITVTAGYINDGIHTTQGGDVVLDAAAANTIDGAGSLNLGAGQLQINNFDHQILSTADLSVTGDISIASGLTVTNYGTITHSGDIIGATGTSVWNNNTDATLNIDGALMATGVLYANASGNTVNYNGSAAQTIKDPSSSTYYNLTCSGSNTKSLSNNIDINGNLIISGTDVLDVTAANNYSVNLAGNWTNSSSDGDPFLQQSGRVTLDGNTDQTIDNSNDETFYDLYIVKPLGGGVTLAAGTDITVSNYASFQKGVIDAATNSCLVSFPAGSSTNGGDNDSFIDGQAKKTGNTDFSFPLGDASVWAPIDISSIVGWSGTEYFTSQYFYSAAPNSSSLGSGIDHISAAEYWDLSPSVDPTTTDVTLYWKDGTRSGIDNLSELIFVHYETTQWENMTTGLVKSGTVSSGSIKATWSSFSEGTLGSGGGDNPLPVELINFYGEVIDEQVNLFWTTASEIDNDNFEIERSEDGIHFETIANIDGYGYANELKHYKYTDKNPLYESIYYRLKQNDFDGISSYSDIINVTYKRNSELYNTLLYPNPASTDKLNISLNGFYDINQIEIIIIDKLGNQVHSQNLILDFVSVNKIIDISKLDPGIYFVFGFNNEDILFKKKLIIIN